MEFFKILIEGKREKERERGRDRQTDRQTERCREREREREMYSNPHPVNKEVQIIKKHDVQSSGISHVSEHLTFFLENTHTEVPRSITASLMPTCSVKKER